MWEQVFASLTPGLTADAAALDAAEAALGFALPASYRAFCTTCGAGLAGGQFRIAVPSLYPATDLITQAGVIAHSVGAAIAMLDAGQVPDAGTEPHRFDIDGGDPGVIERACFFGAGEDGSFLFWDVTGTGPEYDVWLLAPDLETVRFGGDSLVDFFVRATGSAATLLLGTATGPLPARFEGVSESILARSLETAS